MGSQKANNLHTLKPFLEQMLPAYGKSLKNIVAYAGYESEESYDYLEDQDAYVCEVGKHLARGKDWKTKTA